jgi:hypothetical protein
VDFQYYNEHFNIGDHDIWRVGYRANTYRELFDVRSYLNQSYRTAYQDDYGREKQPLLDPMPGAAPPPSAELPEATIALAPRARWPRVPK